MTLLEDTKALIILVQETAKNGDAHGFWASMLSMLETWKASVMSDDYDEKGRRQMPGLHFGLYQMTASCSTAR